MRLQQAISLDSVKNARELGGYRTTDGRTVKSGLLLRAGKLNDISKKDIRTLTEAYRLGYIIDFRMSMELPKAPDPVIEGTEYHHLDVIDTEAFFSEGAPGVDIGALDDLQIAEMTINSGIQNDRMYIGFLAGKMGKRAYSEFFHILLEADPDRAVLWHCTSGKDRTGLAAMLLLTACGVDEETIIGDYLLTNEYHAEKIAATRRFLSEKGYDDGFIDQAVIVYAAVNENYLRNAITFLKNEYGSVDGYIRDGLKITQEEINSLKEKYLD
ncbi:MAG: tyrosine-protein phosphatase [Ruminococcus sp.]|uniref:tyrosine-protein phosphatase n=1 Tax=Ruminococcus sp. TaxID=41978 RepID=UPI0028731D7D|nr:tyrosine-protein phosphatase [Ruminococcus sp.]MBQ3285861.1 tyrosine-protein phosphatase [Ruminococcus sp.]